MSVVRLGHAPGPQTSAKRNRCLPAGRTDTCMLLNRNFNNPGQSQQRLLSARKSLAAALVQIWVQSPFWGAGETVPTSPHFPSAPHRAVTPCLRRGNGALSTAALQPGAGARGGLENCRGGRDAPGHSTGLSRQQQPALCRWLQETPSTGVVRQTLAWQRLCSRAACAQMSSQHSGANHCRSIYRLWCREDGGSSLRI